MKQNYMTFEETFDFRRARDIIINILMKYMGHT